MSEDFSSVSFHRLLVGDTLRNQLYREAIMRSVNPGDVVVDIGTGSGLLAFFACQAGAKRVYAIERTAMVKVAEKIAKCNNFTRQITFINDESQNVEIPQKADVIISELISKFGLGQNVVETISDARDRFLKKNGKIVPTSLQMILVPVEDDQLYGEVDIWSTDVYGIDFSCVREMALNEVYSTRARPSYFLSEPQTVHQINFHAKKKSGFASPKFSFKIKRKGTLQGLCGWFRACLFDDIYITNAPPSKTASWDNIFLPIYKPLSINENDRVDVRLIASPGASGCIWKWDVEVLYKGFELGTKQITKFSHSTLWQWIPR